MEPDIDGRLALIEDSVTPTGVVGMGASDTVRLNGGGGSGFSAAVGLLAVGRATSNTACID